MHGYAAICLYLASSGCIASSTTTALLLHFYTCSYKLYFLIWSSLHFVWLDFCVTGTFQDLKRHWTLVFSETVAWWWPPLAFTSSNSLDSLDHILWSLQRRKDNTEDCLCFIIKCFSTPGKMPTCHTAHSDYQTMDLPRKERLVMGAWSVHVCMWGGTPPPPPSPAP